MKALLKWSIVAVGSVVAGLVLVGLFVADDVAVAEAGGPGSGPAPEADSLAAVYGPEPGGSYSVRAAVAAAVAAAARDPESVDVRACSAPEVDDELGAWTVRCDYTARNGFGGTNRATGRFAVAQGPAGVSARVVD